MNMILNICSIVFGIGAWCFAFAAIRSKKKGKSYGYSVISFSLCILSLVFQFVEIGNRVTLRDFAGIEDTIGIIAVAAGVLAGGTIGLNVIAAFFHSKK